MLNSCSLLLISSLISLTSAETPEGFTPNVPTNLVVTYPNNIQVLPPGQTLPRDVVLEAPSITAPNNATPGNYLAFIMDLDVSRNGQKTTLLHMMQPLTLANTSAASTNKTLSAPTDSPVKGASYIPPSPPAGSGPHRYVELLFAEPQGFTYPQQEFANINPPNDNSARVGFDINAFMKAANLAEPLAGMYFRVENGTSGGSASGTAGAGASGSAGATETASASGGAAATSGSSSVTVGGEAGASATGSATESAGAAGQTSAAPFTGGADGLIPRRWSDVRALVTLGFGAVLLGGLMA